MRTVPLASIPSQSVSVQVDATRYVLRFVDAAGVMAVDIDRAGVPILRGSRIVAGEPLIPYEYLEEGNFIFTGVGDALPDWREFGGTQHLVYLTRAEVLALK